METKVIDIPVEFKRLFDTDWREAAVWGGRFSLKSHTVARVLLIKARQKQTRILCAREFQNSISESSLQLLADLIEQYGMKEFKITNNSITNEINGSEFIFKGLHHNEQSIKSIEGIDIAWVEEAQTITKKSLEILTPTVRKAGSQIIYTYNRLNEEDPIHKRLVLEGRPNTLLINVNYDVALKYGWMPDAVRLEMESDRDNRPALYKQKWLGEPTSQEGRIYSDWLEIDSIPHEASLERYGLDFGYTCLVGETKITTSTGSKRIDEIKIGDFVLTRKGYKRVTDTIDRGVKDVYGVDFGYETSIIATGDHRVFTSGGWKRVDELSSKENVCLLKSNLKEEYINATQTAKTPITFFGKNKKTASIFKKDYIGKYTKNIMVIFLMVLQFTTLTATHLITTLATLWRSLPLSTQNYTITWKGLFLPMVLQKKTGKSVEKKVSTKHVKELNRVSSAVLKYLPPIHIKSFVEQLVGNATTLAMHKLSTFAKSVKKLFWHRLTTQEQHAQKSVHITCRPLKQKRRVYDITVEESPEFFANGVLVHNCDPTAIVAVYRHNGGLIFDEVCYLKGLSNKQIADILLAQPRRALVVADSAEPKSIDEIGSYGVSIVPCQKGKDSIRQGIQLVQSQRISYTKRSHNLRKEYHNYIWRTDRDGRTLSPNVPEDFNNHIQDAGRYAITDMFRSPDIEYDEDTFGDYALKDI